MVSILEQLDLNNILQVIWFLMFFVMIFFYPKMMIYQVTNKMERELEDLQRMTEASVKTVSRKMGKNGEAETRVREFLEFVAVPPVDLDPNGIVAKLDKVVKEQRNSFEYFINENSSIKSPVERQNLEAALGTTMGNHQIAKLVRHFLEIVKKYKNIQIAMIIQIQMPMIRELASTFSKATTTFLDGDPVGDSIGPYVAAHMMSDSKAKPLKGTATVYAVRKINGRRCVIVKADGPGADVGYPGDAMKALMKRYKPARVITIDAMGKMEGEKTGLVAEGVGVAMGGIGTERYQIEEVATKMRIPIDVVAIKMKQEEALGPMPMDVLKAVPRAVEVVERKLERVPKGRTAIILGVGNTSGVGNGRKSLHDADQRVAKNAKRIKEEENKKPKKSWLASLFED